MSNFAYNTRQKSSGGFTTSIVQADSVPEADFLAHVATRASQHHGRDLQSRAHRLRR